MDWIAQRPDAFPGREPAAVSGATAPSQTDTSDTAVDAARPDRHEPVSAALHLARSCDALLLTPLWALEASVIVVLSDTLRDNQFRIAALLAQGACGAIDGDGRCTAAVCSRASP